MKYIKKKIAISWVFFSLLLLVPLANNSPQLQPHNYDTFSKNKSTTANNHTKVKKDHRDHGAQKMLDDTIAIATGEWAPFTGEHLEHNGPVCHVVNDIFKGAGYEVSFSFYPWQRAYQILKSGDVPVSAYWYKSKERQKHGYYSDALTHETIVFYYLQNNPINNWETLSDLNGLRIGASRGNTYTDKFWRLAHEGKLSVDLADNDLKNFKKLLNGRIDIFPCSKARAYELIHKNFPEPAARTIHYHPKPLSELTGHLLFSKAHPQAKQLRQLFNDQLQRLKQQGLFDSYFHDISREVIHKEN